MLPAHRWPTSFCCPSIAAPSKERSKISLQPNHSWKVWKASTHELLQARLNSLTSVRLGASCSSQPSTSSSIPPGLPSSCPAHLRILSQGCLLSVTLAEGQLPPVFGYSLFSSVVSDTHLAFHSFNLSQIEKSHVYLPAGLSPKRNSFLCYLFGDYFKILTINFSIKELSLGLENWLSS